MLYTKMWEFLMAFRQIRMTTYVRTDSLYSVKRLVLDNTALSHNIQHIPFSVPQHYKDCVVSTLKNR